MLEGNKCDKNLFYYGHLDKLPEIEKWTDGKEAFNPSNDDNNNLYGRGSSNGGTSLFMILSVIKAI